MFKNMKKQYMKPHMKVVRIRKMRMLADSTLEVDYSRSGRQSDAE